MSATIYIRWPGLGAEDPVDHPGFGNDDTGYARWIEATASNESLATALKSAGFESLLSVFPADYSDKRINWVEAEKLKAQALRLAENVEAETDLGKELCASYRASGGESTSELLAQDLRDVANIAAFALEQGERQVALTIGW